MEKGVGEIRTLRRTMRDLVALSALPAVWGGYGPLQIAEGLAVIEYADAPSSPLPERGRSTAKQSGGGQANANDPSPALRADPPLSGEGEKKTKLATAAAADARRLACQETL